jgi:isoamylase
MKRTAKAIATGAEQNLSWNCGIEGQSAYPEVERLRNRQIKNFLALTLLATGTPMRLMGDEVRRTQGGNNNAYCQNNEISRLDWGLAEQHADIRRFIKELVALRINRDLPVERLDMTLHELLRRQPVQWHGIELNSPDWSHHTHSLWQRRSARSDTRSCCTSSSTPIGEPLEFKIPPLEQAQQSLRRCIDTYLDPPDDIRGLGRRPNPARLELPGSAALRGHSARSDLRRAAEAADQGFRDEG